MSQAAASIFNAPLQLPLSRHAAALSAYQVMRLGTMRLSAPEAPPSHSWPSALEAFQAALAQEERLLKALRGLAEAAEQQGDRHLAHFVLETFVAEQLEDIGRKLEICTQLRRVGRDSGLAAYDRSLLGEDKKD